MTDAWDGLPPNPERSDHHWLLHPNGRYVFVDRWMRSPKEWFNSGPPEAASVCAYLGPCLLPAEVEARVAAARREGIEAALATAGSVVSPCDDMQRHVAADEITAAIRELLEESEQ